VAELIKRVAAVMVERSEAYDLELPDFAQEVKVEMEAEAAAEAERDGIIEPSKTFGTPPEGEEPRKQQHTKAPAEPEDPKGEK
jgi:hypothetical protein